MVTKLQTNKGGNVEAMRADSNKVVIRICFFFGEGGGCVHIMYHQCHICWKP